MAEKKKYTFEDWKNGKIYRDYENKEIGDFNYKKVKDIGWLPTSLYEQGFIPVKEFGKIDTAQKETFFKVVDQNVKVMVKLFKKSLENAYKPVELIRTKIQSLDVEIKKASNHLLEKVYANEWSKIGIDYSRHMAINDSRFIEGNGMLYFSNQLQGFDGYGKKHSVDLKGKHSNSYNLLFALTILVRFLDELKDLYEKSYLKTQNSNKLKYGTHQENRDWIEKTFREQEPKQGTQNKTVLKVKELYENEFDLKIGKTTILRIVGRAE